MSESGTEGWNILGVRLGGFAAGLLLILGVVTAFVDLKGLLPPGSIRDPADEVLNGIAWDQQGKRLFVTGKRWPSLFEIRVRP